MTASRPPRDCFPFTNPIFHSRNDFFISQDHKANELTPAIRNSLKQPTTIPSSHVINQYHPKVNTRVFSSLCFVSKAFAVCFWLFSLFFLCQVGKEQMALDVLSQTNDRKRTLEFFFALLRLISCFRNKKAFQHGECGIRFSCRRLENFFLRYSKEVRDASSCIFKCTSCVKRNEWNRRWIDCSSPHPLHRLWERRDSVNCIFCRLQTSTDCTPHWTALLELIPIEMPANRSTRAECIAGKSRRRFTLCCSSYLPLNDSSTTIKILFLKNKTNLNFICLLGKSRRWFKKSWKFFSLWRQSECTDSSWCRAGLRGLYTLCLVKWSFQLNSLWDAFEPTFFQAVMPTRPLATQTS